MFSKKLFFIYTDKHLIFKNRNDIYKRNKPATKQRLSAPKYLARYLLKPRAPRRSRRAFLYPTATQKSP